MRVEKAKSKAAGTSRASTPQKSAGKAKSPLRAGSKARPETGVEPAKARKGEKVAGGNSRIAKAADIRSHERADGAPASTRIDQRLRELDGWRGETLARMRSLILDADPEITEEWKWSNPVWSHHGIVCTGEAYTKAVKLTFAHGAKIPDPSRLFNSSLAGSTRRAIDVHEGEEVDAGAFKALVKAAVARNRSAATKR